MISRGVEISIAGGGGEKVRVEERRFVWRRVGSSYPLVVFFFFFFFVILRSLFLGTKSLMQR